MNYSPRNIPQRSMNLLRKKLNHLKRRRSQLRKKSNKIHFLKRKSILPKRNLSMINLFIMSHLKKRSINKNQKLQNLKRSQIIIQKNSNLLLIKKYSSPSHHLRKMQFQKKVLRNMKSIMNQCKKNTRKQLLKNIPLPKPLMKK